MQSEAKNLKFLLTEWFPDWKGETPQQLQRPQLFDLMNPRLLECFIVGLGNAIFEECCIESESQDVLDAVRGGIQGVGGGKQIEITDEIRQRRLFRAGYEVYEQAGNLFFINPVPRPELFIDDAWNTSYLQEFMI